MPIFIINLTKTGTPMQATYGKAFKKLEKAQEFLSKRDDHPQKISDVEWVSDMYKYKIITLILE